MSSTDVSMSAVCKVLAFVAVLQCTASRTFSSLIRLHMPELLSLKHKGTRLTPRAKHVCECNATFTHDIDASIVRASASYRPTLLAYESAGVLILVCRFPAALHTVVSLHCPTVSRYCSVYLFIHLQDNMIVRCSIISNKRKAFAFLNSIAL